MLRRRQRCVRIAHTRRPWRISSTESFDEASFLWRRWESELRSLTRNLAEIWSTGPRTVCMERSMECESPAIS